MPGKYRVPHTCPHCQNQNISLYSLSPVTLVVVVCDKCSKKYMVQLEVEPRITSLVPCPACGKPKLPEDKFCSRCTGEY